MYHPANFKCVPCLCCGVPTRPLSSTDTLLAPTGQRLAQREYKHRGKLHGVYSAHSERNKTKKSAKINKRQPRANVGSVLSAVWLMLWLGMRSVLLFTIVSLVARE